MADSKKKKSKYVELQDDQKSPADTDNFPPPEFLAKPAAGDTGYAIVSAAYHDQTEYFRPGIRSTNQDIAKTRGAKEKSRRVYEHVFTFEEFLNESVEKITVDNLLDWAALKIVGKTVNVEEAIEDYAKSKSIQPEDIAQAAVTFLKSTNYDGKEPQDLDQATLIEIIDKIDEIYGTETKL